MSRIVSLIVAAAATTLLTPMLSLAQNPGLKIGELFEGEIPSKTAPVATPFGYRVPGVSAEVPVRLKADQNISIQVTVSGSTRRVALGLKDPAGKLVAQSNTADRNFLGSIKQTELKIEANASGMFRIVVFSDQVGAFKLRVVSEAGEGGEDEPDVQALEEKIQQLQQDLSEAQAKLKALKKKSATKRR